jgi:hypothetical protein
MQLWKRNLNGASAHISQGRTRSFTVKNISVRKTIGFIVTIIASMAAGYYIAWNQVSVGKFIASIGGIGNLIVVLVGVTAIVLVIIWPKRWPVWLHRVLIAVIILVLIVGVGRVFGDAFVHTPWLALLALIAAILVLVVLYSLTVLDGPTSSWRSLRKKRP